MHPVGSPDRPIAQNDLDERSDMLRRLSQGQLRAHKTVIFAPTISTETGRSQPSKNSGLFTATKAPAR